MKPYYITTTLPYVNADPHIGFALEIIQADVLARYYRMRGNEVVFNTGTDEHGQKIYQKAIENGMEPQAYCDLYAAKFDRLKSALNLSYTKFIRTTDPHHVAAAQEFWKRCDANGDIYKAKYQTKYCVGCELEKQDSELAEGKCSMHPSYELEMREEENYFFRFSKYQQPLLGLYERQKDFVVPDFRLIEIRNFIEAGLQDFSVSRLKEKMPWGVPVPGDEAHIMYVWFDALVNYISTLGWPQKDSVFETFWPGVQVAGKDNLRQQSAMWQAMLLSAGLPSSKQIFIHGFITSDGQKMSKSVGNVVDPVATAELYGIDALRYYLLREIPFGNDGDFSATRYRERYESDLANALGNLLQRVLTMAENYMDGRIPELGSAQTDQVEKAWNIYQQATEAYQFDRALEAVWGLVRSANLLVDERKPWVLAKSGEVSLLAKTLSELFLVLESVGIMLVPYLPETAQKILSSLGRENRDILIAENASILDALDTSERTVKKGLPLFPKS